MKRQITEPSLFGLGFYLEEMGNIHIIYGNKGRA
jgi:hypothetical protein